MEPRIDHTKVGQGALMAMFGLSKYLAKSSIEIKLQHLIELRVSQINGCAYCIDMHSKDLRHEGETEQRLYMLNAWSESPFYTDRERAALEWAETLTLVAATHAPDDVYNRVKAQFTEQEIVDLTFAIATINSWNRLNIALRMVPGTYQPGQFETMTA